MRIVIEDTITAYPQEDEKFKVYFYLIGEGVVPDTVYVKQNGKVGAVSCDEEIMPIIDPGELTQYYIEVSPEGASVENPVTISLSLDEKEWSQSVSYRPTDLTTIEIDISNLLLAKATCSVIPKESTLNDALSYCVFTLFNNDIQIDQSNRIYSPFKYDLVKYYNNNRVKVLFVTKFGYIGQVEKTLSFEYPEGDEEVSEFTITANSERGYNEITVPAGYHLLRKDEAERWIILKEPSNSIEIYNDFIIDYGVNYTYKLVKIIEEEKKDAESEKTVTIINSIISSQEIEKYNLYEDIFLTDTEQKTLRGKYNPDVSSLKRNITDTITATLGSEYPFIRRTAKQKYRTFNIGGLISYNADIYEEQAASSLVDSTTSILDETFLQSISHLSGKDKEFLLERRYRDAVLEYLYDSKPKLFKSPTEGLMLVKISNVSLTPNKQLGRMIYSFSAQATEIAEPTYENFEKYHILCSPKKAYTYNDYILYVEQANIENGVLTLAEDVGIEDLSGDATLIINKESTEVEEG